MSRTSDSPSNFAMDRRGFLLGLGAVPLLAQGCIDEADAGQPRAEPLDESQDLLEPIGISPPLADNPVNLSSKMRRAASNQVIIDDEQACSIPKKFAKQLMIGDQIRIIRNSDEYAIYTVAEIRKKDDPDKVRLALDARLRLGTSKEFSAQVRLPVIATGLTDAQAEAASEFVERLVDDGSNTGLVVIAPHGGLIELNTDLQAERVTSTLASAGASSWICKGWRAEGGTYERWHISSTAISPRSFPALGVIADRGFAYAVSFHGMTSGGVLIGGTVPLEIKEMLRQTITEAIADPDVSVTLADEDDDYNGDSDRNVVNWLTVGGTGGIQIEQGYGVRLAYWQQIADAVSTVFKQLV